MIFLFNQYSIYFFSVIPNLYSGDEPYLVIRDCPFYVHLGLDFSLGQEFLTKNLIIEIELVTVSLFQ